MVVKTSKKYINFEKKLKNNWKPCNTIKTVLTFITEVLHMLEVPEDSSDLIWTQKLLFLK